MPTLLSRDRHPPGGFRFYQPQTNWNAPTWQSFAVVVGAVVSHRRGNPPLQTQYGLSIDPDIVANEVDAYNAQICKANGWTEYYADDESPKPFPHHQYKASAAGVVASVRKTAIGVGALKEWLGDGLKPVDRIAAENRAVICANCPHNTDDPNWLQSLNEKAGELIRGWIEAKNKMELITVQDAKLGACNICDCYLRLKVWSPTEVVQNATPADIREKLPPFCWIKTEAAK